MIAYIVLFSILLICGIYEVCNRSRTTVLGDTVVKYQPKKYYLIIPILFVLVMGIFRETTIGYDSETYYIYYWACIDKYSWAYLFTHFSIDNGFYIILKLIAIFTSDWWFARAILFLITFLLYYDIVREYSPYPATSLIIILGLSMLGLMFSILRQALAGAISLYAYKYIKKKRVLASIIIILIATTIHKSALLCFFVLAVYMLRRKKISTIQLITFSIITYLIFLVCIPFVTMLYADSRYENIATHDGGYGMLAFMIVVTIIIIRMIKLSGSDKDSEIGFLFNISCGAIFVQIGALIWSLFNRASVYFSFYWCLLIPKLLYRLPQKKRRIYFLIVAVLFGFMFFYQIAEVEKYVFHKF